MQVHASGNLKYLTFDSLDNAGVVHGIFTRHGGVSPSPWASLNIGGTVGDDIERVGENRRLMFQSLDLDPNGVAEIWQIHSANTVFADRPRTPDEPYPQGDILLTDKIGISLVMRFADCVPIFLYDPIRKVAGLVHAGWMGTVRMAVVEGVNAMQKRYGTRPDEILAGIGPSIGPDHYMVQEDVVVEVRKCFGQESERFLHPREGRVFFDLWEANRWSLERAGVVSIELSGICTGCDVDHWYSHRVENGRTGRFGALICLT